MRKGLFRLFLFLETLLNLELVTVVLIAMTIFSLVCEYSKQIVDKYGSLFQKYEGYVVDIVAMVFLASLLMSSIKMLVNSIVKGSIFELIKSFVPVFAGIMFTVLEGSIVSKVISLLKADTLYLQGTAQYFTLFWILVISITLKRILNSNEGFYEVSELGKSNDIAIKYFDGSIRDVNIDACDMIALKYGGEENNG